MWYILYMNKDVIYLEPEDDITDIISKIEKSKQKIVALVPPKKAGVFRSVVNMKLIHKAGSAAEKAIVLVTTDPSIIKLAAVNKLPVTSDLKTAPAIPKEDTETENISKEELVEESDGTVETKEDIDELTEPKDGEDSKDEGVTDKKAKTDTDKDDESDKDNSDDDKAEKDAKESADKSSDKKNAKDNLKKGKAILNTGKNRFINWFNEHKKLAIISGVGVLVFIIVLIWALVIAPSVTVTVGIRTTSNNFSEAVTFTTNLAEEDATVGKFYLEEKKVSSTEKLNFEATGKKNIGEKATGDVVVSAFFTEKGTVVINEGTLFTINDLSYAAEESITLSWEGGLSNLKKCENKENISIHGSCQISGRVKVRATEPGEKYNIAASSSGWDTAANVNVYSDKAMSGGTDEEITIVQQSDVDLAESKLANSNLDDNKAKLLEQLGDDKMVIESSLKQEVTDVESIPKVDEEVKPDTKPSIKATVVTSVLVIDKTKVKEFIAEKANLRDDQEIYEMKDPFIESFMKTESGYTGKLKTSYLTGPMLNNTSIVELIRGQGLGDAQHILKDIDGITEVKINTSFPWVTSVPNDSNRITVDLEIKDQNGNKVEHQGINRTHHEEAQSEETSADEESGEEAAENNE